MRSGDAKGEKFECNLANACIAHIGGEDGQAALDTDNWHDEMYVGAGLESSYIGIVSLSNIEPERNVDTHTQLE